LLEIADIVPGSAAEGLGLRKGDRIVSLNGEEVHDVIDYQFLVADEHLSITLLTREGRYRTFTLDKEPDDTMGLQFAPLRISRCRNKCIFCFVDQMPAGCRKSLYVKDDDYRASFLYGNYITLGALSESGWQRIFNQRLSPLYISVHSTDPALRSFIIGNRRAPDIMTNLRRLAEGGIRMHTQVVLCPGVNDGRFLDRTLDDLSGLFPAVSSVAVVPVGVTAFRKGLYPLKTFTAREARTVIETITRLGSELKKRVGARILFASDEFYIKAGLPVPPASFYEDFPQIENGVGMVADFLRDAGRTRLPARIAPLKATIVTGASFSPVLKNTLARLKRVQGLAVKLVAVQNRFFGPAVTVAGLLTGCDIAAALEGKRTGDVVIVSADALKEDEQVFLDGMSLDRLGELLTVKVFPARRFQDILALAKREGGRTSS